MPDTRRAETSDWLERGWLTEGSFIISVVIIGEFMIVADFTRVLIRVLKSIDTLTIRVVLALASIIWAIALLLGTQTFERPGWKILAVVSPEITWAILFLIFPLASAWRMVTPTYSRFWGLVINSYGFAIWFFTTLATNLAIGAFSPSTSLEWTILVAQGYVVVMTGLKKEVVTP